VVVWLLLVFRVGLAILQSESLRDDLALHLIALLVITGVLGSRIWSLILGRS
jgi:hypothetical protein